MAKLIGIAARMLTENGIKKLFVNKSYLGEIAALGFNPFLILPNSPAVEEILGLCDGFLLPGGTDVDPHRYGADNDGSKDVEASIDDLDQVIVDYALRTGKPLLGICRGLQSLNVFAGGTLNQHILGHTKTLFDHEVEFEPSRLLGITGKAMLNSYHHQAIDKVAPGFRVIARHVDGTIEAIEHESLPIFAVQWHPEKTPDSIYSKAVFNSFKSLVE
jgi:putative glutamine amidotransferase